MTDMLASVEAFLRQAVDLAAANVTERGGRPFGAVIVKDNVVIATGVNRVDATGDPTAHAELEAIRAAARASSSPRLDGCLVFASGHPCPMCLSAMYITGIEEVYCALSLDDAEPYGLSTAQIYQDLARPAGERTVRVRCVSIPGGAVELYDTWSKRRAGGTRI